MRCVFDVYESALERYRAETLVWEQRKMMDSDHAADVEAADR